MPLGISGWIDEYRTIKPILMHIKEEIPLTLELAVKNLIQVYP